MAGHIVGVRRDPNYYDPRYRTKMERKLGEPVRMHWMNERTVANFGMRGYHPVERDEDDAEQKYNPDTRVRSGDRFLAAIPESVAVQRDAEKMEMRQQRLRALGAGGHLGAEVAGMVRRGIISPRWAADGFDGKGYRVEDGATRPMGMQNAAPWQGGYDSRPTPHELASHMEKMHSQTGLPEPGDMVQRMSPEERALMAHRRWSRSRTVGSVADNPNSLGKSLRKSGE